MPQTVLIVPVPGAEHLVRPRLEATAPQHLFPEPEDVHAHVTLLAPFVDEDALDDGVLGELDRLFADVTPFDFSLTSVACFPGGATYLRPEPSAPFRSLTHALVRLFPEHPPYGGAFDEVVPHVTVPLLDGETPESLTTLLAPGLPLRCRASEAVLFRFEPGRFAVLERFAFGSSAA